MSARAAILAIGMALAAPVAPDSRMDGLAPYAPLAGHCWRGTFPDGKTTDEHCFSWVYGGRHLRDEHLVRGDGPDYRGETIYSWDARLGRIVYRYWNSDGGYSDGDIVLEDDTLLSPDERYTGEDGSEQVFRSRLRIIDGDRYEVRTETYRDGAWHEAWRISFDSVGPVSARSRPA